MVLFTGTSKLKTLEFMRDRWHHLWNTGWNPAGHDRLKEIQSWRAVLEFAQANGSDVSNQKQLKAQYK